MYYVEQKHNPNKHELMPENYPWIASNTVLPNGIEISQEDYDALINSFDLSEYELATSGLNPKIYNFISPFKIVDKTRPPLDVDYVTGLEIKLHRKSILFKGECQMEEFYEDFDGTNYSNLIVKEEHVFTRDSLGFAIKRETTIKWINENNLPHSMTKRLVKWYNQYEQIEEGKTRRGNLVNGLQKPIMGMISLYITGTIGGSLPVLLEGRKFLAEYKLELDFFVSDSNKAMLDCLNNPNNPKYITTEKYAWIDFMTPYGVTVRNYLLNEMSI